MSYSDYENEPPQSSHVVLLQWHFVAKQGKKKYLCMSLEVKEGEGAYFGKIQYTWVGYIQRCTGIRTYMGSYNRLLVW